MGINLEFVNEISYSWLERGFSILNIFSTVPLPYVLPFRSEQALAARGKNLDTRVEDPPKAETAAPCRSIL